MGKDSNSLIIDGLIAESRDILDKARDAGMRLVSSALVDVLGHDANRVSKDRPDLIPVGTKDQPRVDADGASVLDSVYDDGAGIPTKGGRRKHG